MLIGKLDTKILICLRIEDSDCDSYQPEIVYQPILYTWAAVSYDGEADVFAERAIGEGEGKTTFIIRNPKMLLTKDHYIDVDGYKYQCNGTKPSDSRRRFTIIDSEFVGFDDVENEADDYDYS